MGKVRFSVVVFVYACIVCALGACASAPAAGSSPVNSGAAISSTAKSNTARGRPAWVDSTDSVYPKNQYVAAVGTGNDLPSAQKNALANLISIFGQSIQVDQSISSLYQDAVKNGVITNWTQSNTVQDNITTASSLNTLVGAENKESWDDSRGTVYSIAVMEKAKTAQIYSDMIKANLGIINNLTSMTPAEQNTLEGYSRYQFAATMADINVSYENILKFIGAVPPAGVQRGDVYRLQAVEITKSIPIAVTVQGDRQARIQAAFTKALTELGFRSGGTNSRYKVDAQLSLTEVQVQNSPYKWSRYVLNSNLVDTVPSPVVLVPYNINGREGHQTLSEAENRAVTSAERQIGDDFKGLIQDYLSRMLPK